MRSATSRTRLPGRIRLAMTLALLLPATPAAAAQDSLVNVGLDETFGVFGVILVPTATSSSGWNVFKIDFDHVLAVGMTDRRLYVELFRDSGLPALRFGDGGSVTLRVDGSSSFEALRQPNGRILIEHSLNLGDRGLRVEVLRLHRDGTLDPTFGRDGRALLPTPFSAMGMSMALQPNGRIIVVGCRCRWEGSDGSRFFVSRLRDDGRLDPRFGDLGWVTTTFPSSSQANSVAVQDDGKIVVAGGASLAPDSAFHVARYRPNGALDRSFSDDGVQVMDDQDYARATGIVIQPDGAMVIGGATSAFTFWRLRPDGSIDPTFGNGGRASYGPPLGLATNDTDDLVLRSDGTMAMTGELTDYEGILMAVAVIDQDGALVDAFGEHGWGILAGASGTGIADDPAHRRLLSIGYRPSSPGAYLGAFI